MTGGGSVVVRRQLGSKLRSLRLAAGKDVADVTAAGLGSKAKISRIETGKGPVKVADIRALCWLYGADQATTDALAALAPGTQSEGWWEEYGAAVVPDWFGLYVGLEATASRLRCFEPELVHGLVQTPDYARAVIGADDRLDEAVVEHRVRFRMERQENVFGSDPLPTVSIILGQGTVSLVAGSTETMAAQLSHLRDMAERPNVHIRIVPFAAGAYPKRGSFALLEFDDAEDPSVAYVDVPMGARYFERPTQFAEYEYVYRVLEAKSVPIKEWTP